MVYMIGSVLIEQQAKPVINMIHGELYEVPPFTIPEWYSRNKQRKQKKKQKKTLYTINSTKNNFINWKN